jgi:GDP-L-fucose synthase
VIHLAANVGGVGYLNTNRPSCFYDNLTFGLNVVNTCIHNKVKRLILAGTPCVYGDTLPLPLREQDITLDIPSGPVAGYAFAKLGVSAFAQELCRINGIDVVTFIPSNLYGPKDNFELHRSHIVAALLRKAYVAKLSGLPEFEVWGDGSATRDFIFVEDVSASIVKLAEYENSLNGIVLNLGSGIETKVKDLADLLCAALGNKVKPYYRHEKPVGYKKRVLSCSLAKEIIGHHAATSLEQGLTETVSWITDSGYPNQWVSESKEQTVRA